MILASYPPFLHHTALGIKEKIIRGIYEFHPEYWGHISAEAKDFVSRLLTVDVDLRMTAQQALLHPWVRTLGFMSSACYNTSHHSLMVNVDNNYLLFHALLFSQLTAESTTQPCAHPLKCSMSEREEEEELLTATDSHDDHVKRPTRKRRAKYIYTAPMAINRMRRLYSYRKSGCRSGSMNEHCIYGYLASLSVDTCSELDDSDVIVSGYDSDSTGQRTPSFGSSYVRNQLSSLTCEELYRSATKALRESSGAWDRHTIDCHEKAEKGLSSRSRSFSRRGLSVSSQGTDTECSSSVTSDKSSPRLSSTSSESEYHFDALQILLELAKVDEND